MAQISRTNDPDIEDGNTIDAAPLDAEFDNLVNAHNAIDTTVTALEAEVTSIDSGAHTFSGVKTFGDGIKTDTILEETAAAGVTIDSVLIKDGNINVGSAGYTPAADGDFGYDETADEYKGRKNGTARTFITSDLLDSFHPGFRDGVDNRFYTSPLINTYGISTGAGRGINGTDSIAIPFYVGTPTTFTSLGIHVITAVGGSTVDLGIYANTKGIPTTQILAAGSVSSATTGVKTIVIAQTLIAGWYWLALRSSNAGVGVAYAATTNNELLLGVSGLTGASYVAVVTTGTLPSPWGTVATTDYLTSTGTNTPAIFLRP